MHYIFNTNLTLHVYLQIIYANVTNYLTCLDYHAHISFSTICRPGRYPMFHLCVPGWIYLCITNSYFTSSLYAGYIIVVEYKRCVCFRPVSFKVTMYVSMNVLSQVMNFPLCKLCHFITGKCQHWRNLIMHTAWVSRTTFVLQTGVTHYQEKIYLLPWVHI